MSTCDEYLTAIDEGYDGAKDWMENVQAYAEWFGDNLGSPFNLQYKQMIQGVVNSIHYCLRSLVYADGDYYLPLKVPYYLRHCIGGGDEYELTMEKILDAMWESDILRSFHFINYIDAMRAGIWNTRISEKHLADWYRHFSE